MSLSNKVLPGDALKRAQLSEAEQKAVAEKAKALHDALPAGQKSFAELSVEALQRHTGKGE